MGFWEAIAIMVVAVAAINAFKEIKLRRGGVRESELKALKEEIEEIRRDVEEIKNYIADLIIRLHDEEKLR